ncbi:hypothetical protein [Clostridium sp.]|uniref:hypothetical protein n=1 Tax=Clostridium sp. TaxID=1506 RepID=UPI001A5BC097|nr:hypothetical protein [Clostridium sp.]MBK5241117.1 hypothetical protein [Clostridium sp.]
MDENEKTTWQKILYTTGELKFEGFTKYHENIKELVPCGEGVYYFINGNKYMQGSFGNDWFIEAGTEYYENGNIRFIGEYNKGPRNYYGPRYFVFGRLFDESGTLWYEGRFHYRKSTLGYPYFEKEKSFAAGTEFNSDGSVKKIYSGDKVIETDNVKIEIEIKAKEKQLDNEVLQELSKEVLEKLDKMDKEAIESMVKSGYSREEAEAQANAFS